MGLLDRIRPQPGFRDPDPAVRRAAVRDLDDPLALADLAKNDPDDGVREHASEALLALALKSEVETIALQALAEISEAKHLLSAARSATLEAVGRAALARLHEARALGSVARHGEHPALRLEALARLSDPAELHAVALKSPHRDIALRALERASQSSEDLDAVAQHARCPAAARRARAILHERSGASEAPALPQTDRPRQIELCERVEALARSEESERLQESLAGAKDAWTDLLPNVDDDLHDRFTAACDAARARLRRNLALREESLRREAGSRLLHERHLAPRLLLCDMVEGAEGAEAPRRLEDARWEWERLPPIEPGEPGLQEQAAEIATRFESACSACQEGHALWEKEQAEAGLKAQRAREQADRERRQAGNLTRLNKLADRLERLLGSSAPSLKKAAPGLREVRAALDDMPELPTRRDHHALLDRLRALHTALAPKVAELRDSDGWKRWANANVQEELCAAVEALLELEPVAAAARLRELQERWKTASVASRDRSQQLWERFQAGAEKVRARLAEHRAAQEEAAAANRARKEALCERAESFGASTEWGPAAAALKGLQIEWKTVGPASRGHEKVLWERFRKACDQFFTRRDSAAAARKETWAKNLAAREALCAQAEALAASTDWKTAAEAVKRLQAEWKTIGAVRRARSETTWTRFRSACDRFFERYKRRDSIEIETRVAARDALCSELEALVPSGASAEAAASPEATAAAAEAALFERVQSIRGRWQSQPPLPAEIARPLFERFQSALGRIVERHPDSVRGTDLDADSNLNRLEEICRGLEKLLPQGAGADDGLSPAARLALRWREAMATNTIGGREADEARWRGLSEEMRKAQESWQRVGYVPEATRAPIAARFEAVCRRIVEARPQSQPDPRRRAGAPAGRR